MSALVSSRTEIHRCFEVVRDTHHHVTYRVDRDVAKLWQRGREVFVNVIAKGIAGWVERMQLADHRRDVLDSLITSDARWFECANEPLP